MTTELTFFVEGDPVAQPRVKAARRGNFIHIYTPPTADAWKKLVGLRAKEAVKLSKWKHDGSPLGLRLLFWMPRPKSHFRTGKFWSILRDDAPKQHTSKPDIDNLQKAVMDAMTDAGIYSDDCLIFQTEALKAWAGDGFKAGCHITLK